VRRMIWLLAVIGSAMLAGALVLPGPALAHGTATVEPAQAGAANALITITVEAESTKSGAASVRVVLPDGIAPGDVTYVTGPSGWSLKPETDGYTVSGPALPAKRNTKHQVRVKQLPSVPTLAFKLVQTYADGQVDRWIEVPSAANPKPDNPAAVVNLQPPPGGFQPSSPPVTSAPPSTPAAPSSTAPATAAAQQPAANSGGGNVLPWILAVIALTAVAAGAAFFVIRRRASGSV
jgi:uncharacterized protein YcnI